MNKDLHGYVENETRCLMEAPSCCREARGGRTGMAGCSWDSGRKGSIEEVSGRAGGGYYSG